MNKEQQVYMAEKVLDPGSELVDYSISSDGDWIEVQLVEGDREMDHVLTTRLLACGYAVAKVKDEGTRWEFMNIADGYRHYLEEWLDE